MAQPNETQRSAILTIEAGGFAAVDKLVDVVRTRADTRVLAVQTVPSVRVKLGYDVYIDYIQKDGPDAQQMVVDLEAMCEFVTVLGMYEENSPKQRLRLRKAPSGIAEEADWFPRRVQDMDYFANKVMSYGEELDADHPGFTDEAYRARRAEIVEIARNYRHGEKIPQITYTEGEVATWRQIYTKLKELLPTHACSQFNRVLPILERECGYSPDNIPQLEDISRYLKSTTGWTLRPVQGLLSSRDFINGLAFRVFHSTQYIRHPSKPMYTPEPDICHEIIGHVPLFADPAFARFSQELGMASLGASDAEIQRLSTCYWFTAEFGLCRQDGELRAYGAGLLSSFGELEYCLTNVPEKKPFDPKTTAATEYPITMFQPQYFYSESFEIAKQQVIDFAQTLERPFNIRFNALTETMEIIDCPELIARINDEVRTQSEFAAKCVRDLKTL